MESTKTFVEHPSGKLAVTVHAPRSLREEEAAYFHGINLEQAHKFAHLNGWQLTVDREKDDTVSAADADSFKIGDATIDGVGGKGQQAVRIEAKVGVSDGAEKTDVPIPTEKDIKRNLLWGIGCTSFGLFCFVVGLFASFFCVIIGLVFIVLGVGSLSLYRSGKKDRQLAETDFEAYNSCSSKTICTERSRRTVESRASGSRRGEKTPPSERACQLPQVRLDLYCNSQPRIFIDVGYLRQRKPEECMPKVRLPI